MASQSNDNPEAVREAIKPQIDKWLQTTILNNTTVTLSKPKPCILAFSDRQFLLYDYFNGDDGAGTYFHYYYFSTPVLPDGQTVLKIYLTLATTLNSVNIGFADYNVDSVSYSEETISGGGGAISDVVINGNSVVNDVGQVVFNSRYFTANDAKLVSLDTSTIMNDANAANKNYLPKISSATAQPDPGQEVGIYIRTYNSVTSDNISYYNLVDNTYNTEVPGYSGQWWIKYAFKWLADTNEFEIQQIPGKAED